MLKTHCKCAAFILDAPLGIIMMFTYKEIIDKMETNLTDPKYHELLVLDDARAQEKRNEKKREKEKENEYQKQKEAVVRRKKRQKLAESKILFFRG